MTPPPSDQIESPDEPEPSTVDAAQDNRTTNIRQRLSTGLSKALDPVRDQVEQFSEEQVERKAEREVADAKRKVEKEAGRAAAASAQAVIDDQFRVHFETGVHPVLAAQREEFREALNGLLNPKETLVEFVDAFFVQWVFAPNTAMKGTYRDRHAGSHYPVRTEVWLALTSERLRRGQWATGMVSTGHGYDERERFTKWILGENPPAYPSPGFGYSGASLPVPEVFASETIEIEQVRRVQVAAGGHQDGYHLVEDLQPTHFPENRNPDQLLYLQYTWVWQGLGMNGWHLRDPLPPLYSLSGSIGSDQFDYWSFDHRILDLGRALQERKALTSMPEAGQEELPPSEAAAPKAELSPEVTVSGELGRLAELHQQGLLSDDEFAKAKKKVLGL